MSLTLIPTQTSQDYAADTRGQDARRHLAVLNEFIEVGADMVRFVRQQAKTLAEVAPEAGETGTATAELATAFERITRSVRRSMLLAAKLAEPVTVADPARPRVAARQRIIRAVEDSIQRETHGAAAETLHAELLDRLDSADFEDDLGDRPVEEIIGEICNDLGLDAIPGSHLWARRTPADLAVLCARAAAPPRSRRQAAYARANMGEGPPLQSGTALPQGVTRCRDP